MAGDMMAGGLFWARAQPTFWELKKCAAFRQLHRYQLHVALAVAFSFFEQNGTAAEKWKMGGFGQKRRYQRHLECLLGMTENDAQALPCNRGRPVYGDPLPVCVAWDRFEVTMEASSEWLWR